MPRDDRASPLIAEAPAARAKRLVLGVVGHVDHGKTSLVRALTGMETDRLAEEKRRGISIALGFAHGDFGGEVDFVDAPGHERFVRTLVSGVTGADAVLLVLAANEGIKPQTREHLTIAALLGVQEALVVVAKSDLAAPDQVERVGRQALALARELGIAASGPVPVSALTGEGLDALKVEIAGLLARRPPPPDAGFPCLPIDRAFLMSGHGLVVTGTLRRGTLSPDMPVELLPGRGPVRIRGLQVHGRPTPMAAPGQRVAVNLKGVEADAIDRGMVLAGLGALAPADWITVELRVAPDAPSLRGGARLELLVGAAQVPVRLRLLDRDVLEPGDTGFAQLHGANPIVAAARDGFVLRTASPPATLAGGRVLDPDTRRQRRRDPQRLSRLGELATAEGPAVLRLALEEAGPQGAPLTRLARLAGLSPTRAAETATRLGAVRLLGEVFVVRAELERAGARLLDALRAATAPLPRRSLIERLRLGPEVFDAALSALVEARRARVEGGRVALVRAAQDRARADVEAALARRFADQLREAGLSPPDLLADAREPLARRALERLVRDGAAVRAVDRVQKRELLFHAEAVEAARRRLAPLLAPPGLLVGEVGRALGVSRKFSVPLLEHLDAIRFTRRIGDRRVLAAQAACDARQPCGGD